MARREKYQPMYDAIQVFKEQCLLQNRSILWPGLPIWTKENLLDWRERFIDNPLFGSDLSFKQKLELQLQGASPYVLGLVAEISYVYFIPSDSFKFETKYGDIEKRAVNGNLPIPTKGDPFWDPLKIGFTSTGLRYHLRYPQYSLITEFALAIKDKDNASLILDKSNSTKELLNALLEKVEVKKDRGGDMRDALLYLMFPDEFERSISTMDKERMVARFGSELSENIDLDKRLLMVRNELSKTYGADFDFYDDLDHLWKNSGPVSPPTPPPPPEKSRVLKESSRLLKRYKNLIYFGPPGTGKTYWAHLLKNEMIQSQLDRPPVGDFWKSVTFHQSYAYEDFVEGLRPKVDQADGTNLTFELKQGAFRDICNKAEADPKNQYVLIIDEINRGNIAKIFGELISLIETDKRGKLSVALPYSKEEFTVPTNLFIIGTMNTADRSIALLDVALRRRFAFFELMPDSELLSDVTISVPDEDVLNVGTFLEVLNRRVLKYRGRDYQIGHSFFIPLRSMEDNLDKLSFMQDVWNYQVIPQLKEYFYSQPDQLEEVLRGVVDDTDEQSAGSPLEPLSDESLVAAFNRLITIG